MSAPRQEKSKAERKVIAVAGSNSERKLKPLSGPFAAKWNGNARRHPVPRGQDLVPVLMAVSPVHQADVASFSHLVDLHQTWAWRVAYRFTGNEEDASDIIQDAFLNLFEASGRYRPTAKFRTYFYRIISRTAPQTTVGHCVPLLRKPGLRGHRLGHGYDSQSR